MLYKLIYQVAKQYWFLTHKYLNQSVGFFKIDGIIDSEEIKINRGVKQGGVLSPQLFNFFINEMLLII